MAKLMIEVGTLGLKKVTDEFMRAEQAAARFATTAGSSSSDRVRTQFQAQQNAVERFRQSLEQLKVTAREFGAGASVGTAAAAFNRFQERMDSTVVSSGELATQMERLQGIFDRTAVRVTNVGAAAGNLSALGQQMTALQVPTVGASVAVNGLQANTMRLANTLQGGLTQGANAARASINSLGQRIRAARPDAEKFTQTMRNLGSSAVLVVGPLSGIGARLIALGAIANRTNVGLAVLFGGLAVGIATFGQIIRASSKAEEELATLDGVLIATGKSALFTAERVREIAESIVDITPGGNIDELNKASAALLTFANVGERELERLLRLSSDLAAVGFQSTERAARTLGAALESPSTVIERLNRVVPIFRGALGDTIRELEKAGRVTEAANILLESLEDRVGGVSERMNVGMTAALGNVSAQFRRLSEEIGNATGSLTFATDVVNALGDTLAFLRNHLQTVNVVLTAFTGGVLAFGIFGIVKLVVAIGALVPTLIAMVAAGGLAFGAMQRLNRINEEVERSTKGLKGEVDNLTQALVDNAAGSREAVAARITTLQSDLLERESHLRQAKAIRENAGSWDEFLAATDRVFRALPGFERFERFMESTFPMPEDRGKTLNQRDVEMRAQEETIASVREQLERLITAFNRFGNAGTDTAGEVSKEFKKAEEAIRDILLDLSQAGELLDAARLGEPAVRMVEAMQEVRGVLEGLSGEELQALADIFGFAGGSVEQLVKQLAKFIVTTGDIEDTKDAVADYREELEDTRRELALLTLPEHARGIAEQQIAFDKLAKAAGASADEIGEFTQNISLIALREFVDSIEDFNIEINKGLSQIQFFRDVNQSLFDQGKIGWEEYTRGVEAARIATEQLWETTKSGAEELDPVIQALDDAFSDMADGLVDAFIKVGDGIEGLKEAGRRLIESLIRDLLQLSVINPIRNALFDFQGAQAAPTFNPASLISTGISAAGSLLGFQHGGSFRVGGAGGPDSQLVAFKASPGERVTVTPNEQGTREPSKVELHLHGVTDFDSFRRSESQMMAAGHRAAAIIERRNRNR